MDVEVTTSGPLFDGSAERAAEAFNEDAARTVADEGVVMVRQRLAGVLKNPSGYYESRIDTLARGDYAEVWDSNVVYGGWLERGRSGSRFKGYATFRIVSQQLDARAVQIAESVLPPYLARMNG
jgi:hypothetical protein